MTLLDFIEKYQLEFDIKQIDKRPDDTVWDNSKYQHYHYEIEIYSDITGNSIIIYYSTGVMAGYPEEIGILYSLRMDAMSWEDYGNDLEELMANFGYYEYEDAEILNNSLKENYDKLVILLGLSGVEELLYSVDEDY